MQERLFTESPFTHQCICVLQRCGLPSRIPEIIRQKLLRRRLFSVPGCHSPKPEEHVLLLQRQVIETAVNWILLVCLGVFISAYVLKLCPLKMPDQPLSTCTAFGGLTKAEISVIHMNMPLSLACSQSILPWNCLDARSTSMSWLLLWYAQAISLQVMPVELEWARPFLSMY